MGTKLAAVMAIALFVCGTGAVGCKKATKTESVDPHSAEGVMLQLQQQGRLLNDALGRQDFQYIHDYAYHFNGLAQAFYSRLDDQHKEHVRRSLEEVVALGSQLDHSAGRRHAEATETTLKRLQVVLQELDKQFREIKQKG
jgi:hypothetical protein